MNGDGRKLLRISDVCERLQIGKSTVFKLLESGELKSVLIRGSRRVTEQQLADFIAHLEEST